MYVRAHVCSLSVHFLSIFVELKLQLKWINITTEWVNISVYQLIGSYENTAIT